MSTLGRNSQIGVRERVSSPRRKFLQLLTSTSLVLSLDDILQLARPSLLNAFPFSNQGETAPKPGSDLGLSFVDVAHESGLNAKTIYGGEHKNKYLLETTGCGVAFYDYDNDGWLDIFVVNGTSLGGFSKNKKNGKHVFKDNHDGVLTKSVVKAGLRLTG